MYVFYDTESSGLHLEYSQILQIALAFTDDDLNILSSKKMECRRSPWVVPSPGAMLTTGFVPDDLKNNPYSHYEMMHAVSDWLRSLHWPLMIAGYNTLRYDDPLLANNFFQNLMHPDIANAVNNVNGQKNGCLDIMVMVKAAMLYAPGVLKLDIKNHYGEPSLALGSVARQNGVVLNEEDAHDAMNDIRATIGVAKIIMKAAPDLWAHLVKMGTVAGVNAFLEDTPVFTYTSTFHGKIKSHVAASITGREGGGDTQVLFDLSYDPASYLAMTQEELADVFRARDTTGTPQPFILMRKQMQPVLMHISRSDAVLPPDFDDHIAAQRAAAIRGDKDFQARVSAAAALVKQEQKKDYVGTLPEQQLEKEIAPGLQSRLDLWAHEFHDAPNWEVRRDLVDAFCERFAEEIKADETLRRYPRFAERIVYEHAPEVLGADTQKRMKRYIASRLLDPDPAASYLTIPKARQELEKIETDRAQGLDKWKAVTDGQIRSLKLYYRAMEKEYTGFGPGALELTPPPPPDSLSPRGRGLG